MLTAAQMAWIVPALHSEAISADPGLVCMRTCMQCSAIAVVAYGMAISCGIRDKFLDDLCANELCRGIHFSASNL